MECLAYRLNENHSCTMHNLHAAIFKLLQASGTLQRALVERILGRSLRGILATIHFS